MGNGWVRGTQALQCNINKRIYNVFIFGDGLMGMSLVG